MDSIDDKTARRVKEKGREVLAKKLRALSREMTEGDPVTASMLVMAAKELESCSSASGQSTAEQELDRINRVAATASVDSWMSLSDEDKRKWFAQTLRIDKHKTERIRTLEDKALWLEQQLAKFTSAA